MATITRVSIILHLRGRELLLTLWFLHAERRREDDTFRVSWEVPFRQVNTRDYALQRITEAFLHDADVEHLGLKVTGYGREQGWTDMKTISMHRGFSTNDNLLTTKNPA